MPRLDPPYASDERTMLVAFLDYYRETLILKCEGLTPEQLRWAPAPAANSLIGLLNHLAYVEHWWFHECLLGKPDELPRYGDPDDRDFEMKVPLDTTLEDVVTLYRRECARSNEITARATLDDVAVHSKGRDRGVTLRWILVHLIEETARHAGHADITRELIDGATGD